MDELRLTEHSRRLSTQAEMIKLLSKQPPLEDEKVAIRKCALQARLEAEAVMSALEA